MDNLKVPLKEGSFWKWHGWLEALLYLDEQEKYEKAVENNSEFETVKLARAG